MHRVLGIDTDDAALGISTIERALWTAQHIDTVEHIEMGIERRLRHQGNVVVVDAHRRIVHTRAYTSYIYRGGQTAAILRHGERRHITRQLAHALYMQLTQVAAAQRTAAHRLLAQQEAFLGLCDNDDLVEVYYFRSIVHLYGVNEKGTQEHRSDKNLSEHFLLFLKIRCKGTAIPQNVQSLFIGKDCMIWLNTGWRWYYCQMNNCCYLCTRKQNR